MPGNSEGTVERDGRWREAADFVASLGAEDQEALGREIGTPVPEDPEEALEVLRLIGGEDSTPSDALALAGVRVATSGERELSRRLGQAAAELAQTPEERQLAHACLAQSAFKFRKDPQSLADFERHCREAMDLGHAGTFCYERLAVLYEYRGETEEAIEVCRRAERVLAAAGDPRSAESFRERAEKIARRAQQNRARPGAPG
ncbi:Hypothetical Protein RradSPS_0745 [Rubrobacter radiotolerans]|uniref:Tetratricopeptide repeat n=1 Tax=Rubrobacter radiotolerans TaxID=42256 RepID=A0A023X140_RUBRA|nr:hypothetical protein [Rubrobacter radiotolerans]AHY46028.1 Hypothetical Protein RradSPS_0745 [Rubrobacter radiotolerans]MDX5893440.1 hypothetical protein [Rubrobacter radiotolerans]SMC03741.1 tetratricopeptide TPR_2 [Rubrobacter radiotolerans DSM 5868]